MKVNLGIWGKLTQVFLVLLFLTVLAGVLVWYLPLIQRNEQMRKRKLELEDRIRQEEVVHQKLLKTIRAVEDDPKTVERLVREKLGHARTNEMVIRFEAATNSTAKVAPGR